MSRWVEARQDLRQPVLRLAAVAGITAFGLATGRDEAAYLRSWPAERLQTPEV